MLYGISNENRMDKPFTNNDAERMAGIVRRISALIQELQALSITINLLSDDENNDTPRGTPGPSPAGKKPGTSILSPHIGTPQSQFDRSGKSSETTKPVGTSCKPDPITEGTFGGREVVFLSGNERGVDEKPRR